MKTRNWENEIEVFGIKVPIPEYDKMKNSDVCRLPAKKAKYLDMSLIGEKSYKTEHFETNTLETYSLQRTYSLFTHGFDIDRIAEVQGMSIEAVFRQFEQLILTGKVRYMGGLLPPERQRQIKAVLEILETELDSLIRARIGEKCQEEDFKFVRALLLSKICFSQS